MTAALLNRPALHFPAAAHRRRPKRNGTAEHAADNRETKGSTPSRPIRTARSYFGLELEILNESKNFLISAAWSSFRAYPA